MSHFEPTSLLRLAVLTVGPAIALAGVGSIVVLVYRLRRGKDPVPRFWNSMNTVLIWPVYLWCVLASFNTILTADLVTAHVEPQIFWATQIALFIGLGMVLAVALPGVILGRAAQSSRETLSIVGALFGIAAVAADGVFFLTVLTPFGR